MATWPTTLPQSVLSAGFSESTPNLVIRSNMDAGPAKVRQRISNNVRVITPTMVMTTAQVATFDTFFVTTLGGGALPFDWKSPRTEATVSMRFTDTPKYTAIGGGYFSVSLPLEILP